MLFPMLGELLQFEMITKHTWEWEIDERKKQQLSQHQICCQIIRHQKFLSKHQKW